jgi:hypothetical protein
MCLDLLLLLDPLGDSSAEDKANVLGEQGLALHKHHHTDGNIVTAM